MPDIEEIVREFLLHDFQAGAFGHGRGQRHDRAVALDQLQNRAPENFRIGRAFRAVNELAVFDIERRRRMIGTGVSGCRHIALALAGHHVQQDRKIVFLGRCEFLEHLAEIMAIDRTDVLDAQFFKKRSGHHHGPHQHFNFFGQFIQRFADDRNRFQDILDHFLHADVGPSGNQVVQMAGNAADIGRYRHLVVVENDDQPLLDLADMVQGFQGHAAGQGSVADDGDDMKFSTLAVAGNGQARGKTERGRGMTGVQNIVFTFIAVGKTQQAVFFADGEYPVAAAGDDLVGIALVADIPDDLVSRGIENPVQGQGQVDNPQVGRQVPAVARNHLDQQVP